MLMLRLEFHFSVASVADVPLSVACVHIQRQHVGAPIVSEARLFMAEAVAPVAAQFCSTALLFEYFLDTQSGFFFRLSSNLKTI